MILSSLNKNTQTIYEINISNIKFHFRFSGYYLKISSKKKDTELV